MGVNTSASRSGATALALRETLCTPRLTLPPTLSDTEPLAALSETVAVSDWLALGSVMLTLVNGLAAFLSVVATMLVASDALIATTGLTSVSLIETAGAVIGSRLLVSVRMKVVTPLVLGTPAVGVNDAASTSALIVLLLPVMV